MDVTRRRPQARVAFLGPDKRLLIPEPETLVSVKTLKSKASPTGAFEIVFAPITTPGQRRSNQYQTTVSGAPDQWFDALRPMSLVFIALGNDADLQAVEQIFSSTRTSASGASLGSQTSTSVAVQRAMVMVGVIDSVEVDAVVTDQGPKRAVHVRGQDLAKFLAADTIRPIWTVDPDQVQNGVRPGLVVIGHPQSSSSAGVSEADALAFITRMSPVAGTGFLATMLRDEFHSVSEVAKALLDVAPSLHVTFANGQTVRDYLPDPVVDPSLDLFRIFAMNTYLMFQGSVWEAVQRIAPAPCAECFLDTVGFGAQLVLRRPPFARPAMMPYSGRVNQAVVRTATTADEGLQISSADLFTRDDFTSVPSRVIPNGTPGQCYHTITAAEIIGLQKKRGDNGVITQYQVLHKDMADGDPRLLSTIYPILTDVPASFQFGTRPMQAMIPWWSGTVSNDNTTTDPTAYVLDDPKIIEVAAGESTRLYYYFRDNAEFFEGAIEMRGRPEIRIGDRVWLADSADDMIAYVEEVQQSWEFGRPFITTVGYSRGHPKSSTKRLATYDTDPPLGL